MRRRDRFFIQGAAFALLLLVARISLAAEPIVTTDLLKMRTVAAIDVAKDGSRAVYSVKSIATIEPMDPASQADPTWKYQTHLFAIDLNDKNAAPRQITFGDRNDSSPRISPDGKRVAFVRTSEKPVPVRRAGGGPPMAEQSPQIWLLNLDGGEAQQLTAFSHGATQPVWSPDGRSLLVSSAIPLDELEGTPVFPMERPQRTWKDAMLGPGETARPAGTRAEIRAWLDRNAAMRDPEVINRLEFQDETELLAPIAFVHLYVISAQPGSEPVAQSAARRLTSGFADHNEAAFMPDGQSVVYAAKKYVDVHPDRMLTTSLWQINIDGSNDRQILTFDNFALNAPKPSRDGTALAFVGQLMDQPAHRQSQLGMALLKGDTSASLVWLTGETTFPGSVEQFDWIPSQAAAIAFTAPMRGGEPLLTISAGIVQPAPLIPSPEEGKQIGVRQFALGGGAIVYSRTSVEQPCTLRIKDARGDRQLDDLNPWVANKTISTPAEGWITRPDGTRIQYWIMSPTDRTAGMKYPFALEMHGGPSAMWGPGEFTMWHEFQLLCSWGYGVVYCNPRGSGGYGYEFQRKNFQDWGEGPGGDVLAAVDQAVLLDWVDRDKLVITGGSYAGYLTAWIIEHDNRFQAAVAQRGVYDFGAFYGEGNAWRLVAWAMGGTPLDPRVQQVMERNNVMNHAARIRTPLLIKHGSSDLRTGVSQSEMLYRALKDLGRPVEYVRYPDAGHELSRSGDPLQRMDRLNRIIEFFERYVDNARPAPVLSGN